MENNLSIDTISEDEEASVGESDAEEKRFYPVAKSRKFITLPTGTFDKEEVIHVIKPEAEGESLIFSLDDGNNLGESADVWKDSMIDDEDTRRRVYWAGPGLVQERYTKSIFPPQDIPEGLRPTLAYVPSDELVSKDYPTVEKAYPSLENNLIKKSFGSRDSQTLEKEKRPQQKKRWFRGVLKLIGIK